MPRLWSKVPVLVVPLNLVAEIRVNPQFARFGPALEREKNAIIREVKQALAANNPEAERVMAMYLVYDRDIVFGQTAIDAYRAAHPTG